MVVQEAVEIAVTPQIEVLLLALSRKLTLNMGQHTI